MDEQWNQPVVSLLKSLIQTRSCSGEERAVGKLLKQFFEDNEFDSVCIDSMGICREAE